MAPKSILPCFSYRQIKTYRIFIKFVEIITLAFIHKQVQLKAQITSHGGLLNNCCGKRQLQLNIVEIFVVFVKFVKFVVKVFVLPLIDKELKK